MEKIIKEVDKKKGILQVTTLDERFYAIPVQNEAGLPSYKYIPSITWICGHYPKGIGFYRWLANTGWDESQALKNSAGDKGSKVHHGIEKLLKGETLNSTDRLENGSGVDEEITLEEWKILTTWRDWYREVKPEILKTETTVFSDNYAGTIDCVARIGSEVYIIDWKTSQSIWTEYELQVSAYRQALMEEDRRAKRPLVDYKLAILQVGYAKNRKGYKWNVIENKFELFKHAQAIWANENDGKQPKTINLPLQIKL